MLKVENLYLSFTKDYYTLNDINFEIKDAEKLIIVGNKESGRTALIRTLVGLENKIKGNIIFKNIPLEKIDFENDISLGYLPAIPAFLENKTVKANVEYVLKLRKEDKSFWDVKVNNALIGYGLEYLKNRKAKDLNYLDRIKLALARLSVRSVELFLIDDIFAKLSKNERDGIIKNIKAMIKSNGASALIMTDNEEVSNQFNYNKKYLVYGSLHDEKEVEIS